jgi:hypothetical protein
MPGPALTPPGRLSQWRLAEPVRFYLWPVFAVLVLAVAWQAAAGEWPAVLVLGLAAAGLFGAGEAARASVYASRRTSRSVVTLLCGLCAES